MKVNGLLLASAIFATAMSQRSSAIPGDQNWDSRFGLAPGFNGRVRAFAVVGTNLFVGGNFTRIGEQQISGVARWDGTQWYPLGSGMNGSVYCLAADGTNLYAGGHFSSAGGIAATNIARWDGQTWSALGTEFPLWGGVYSLAVNDSKLYLGGTFHGVGGIAATNIAVWDGVQWTALGDGLSGPPFGYGSDPGGTVSALLFEGNNLYAGGTFTTSGSTALTNVARWDGSQWYPLGDGTSAFYYYYNSVRALAFSGGRVLVGGQFTGAGAVATTNLAWWDGTNWSTFPTDTELNPAGFLTDDSGVIVFGTFPNVGGANSSAIARFDGTNWTGYGSGIAGTVNAAVWFGSNLYVGGEFQVAGGKSAGFIARWDGHEWQSLFSGKSGALFGWPTAMTADSNGVYVAGSFISAGEAPVKSVAHFDGNEWTSMDEGLSPGTSHLLSNVGTNLYLVEQNSSIIPSPTTLMRWNGSSWSPVASDLTYAYLLNGPRVTHLVAGETNLYIAGVFRTTGTELATNLVRWDGGQWHSLNYVPLRLGGNEGITTMATRGETLFIAEHYPDGPPVPGGDPIVATNAIRYWDGTNWSNIGSNVMFRGENDVVEQIVCMESNLFAGGRFVATNPVPATNLLRWDGSFWHAADYPFGTNSWITSLAVSGTNLYVRGWFWDTNGFAPLGIAKWDGNKWSELGSGLGSGGIAGRPRSGPGASSDLVAVGREVYVWGGFTTAGGKSSYQFASWHEFPTVTLSPRGWLPNGHFALSIVGSSGQSVQIQSSPDLDDWTDLGPHTPDSDDYEIEDDTINGDTTRFYRALLMP